MKSTGVVRPVDRMGRVVIPKEIRKQLNIKSNVDSLEIYMENDSIILKKYQPACVFCEEILGVIEYNNHYVCPECIKKMMELKEQSELSEETDYE